MAAVGSGLLFANIQHTYEIHRKSRARGCIGRADHQVRCQKLLEATCYVMRLPWCDTNNNNNNIWPHYLRLDNYAFPGTRAHTRSQVRCPVNDDVAPHVDCVVVV